MKPVSPFVVMFLTMGGVLAFIGAFISPINFIIHGLFALVFALQLHTLDKIEELKK